MIHHLVTGAGAAAAIKAAVSETPALAGEVYILQEALQAGPLTRAMNQSFDETRAAWWQELLPAEVAPPAGAQELLLQLSNSLNKHPNAVVWIWMAPHPADISTYYFALSQLEKHRGRLCMIQIAGLPFLDEQQKLFFPKSFAGLSIREIAKCQKLVRVITPSEWEVDLDAWKQLAQAPAGIRIAEGGKKLASKNNDYYDEVLLRLCTDSFQKAARIVQQAVLKNEMYLPEYFLGWRLRTLAAAGQLSIQGDADKTLRDFELKRYTPVAAATDAANAEG